MWKVWVFGVVDGYELFTDVVNSKTKNVRVTAFLPVSNEFYMTIHVKSEREKALAKRAKREGK